MLKSLRVAGVVVVLGLGIIAVAASGNSSSKSGGNSNASVPSSGGATQNTAVSSGEHPAANDVSIGSCGTDPTLGTPTAHLVVVNHSSKTSNYLISIAFDSPDGAMQYDTAAASVDNLAPGQTGSDDATGTKNAPAGFICKVADVTRLAS